MDYKKLRSELIKRTSRYAEQVRQLYETALADIAREFAMMDYNHDVPFSFESVGKFGKVDEIMSRLESQIQLVVEQGIRNEFGTAYNGCSQLVEQVVRESVHGNMAMLKNPFAPKVASGVAADRFITANRSGDITHSLRVWNGAVLGQMETAVEEGLMDGMPAKRMATLLKDYLVEPDNCFRRFRIKTGVDADGKSMYGRKWKKRVRHEDGTTSWFDADPRDYGKGDGMGGVYHSSYKNALRYARTTTNIAYRTADYDRYQEFPFVIGIEIHLSNNPNHVMDICDTLAGKYPKEFKWTGWHPQCMCYQIPLLANGEEVDEMVDAILDGDDPSEVPVQDMVMDLPQNFKDWVKDNEQRIADAKSLPYFLRDNGGMHNGHFYQGVRQRQTEKVWSHLSETHDVMDNTKSGNAAWEYLHNPAYNFGIYGFEKEVSEILSKCDDTIESKKLMIGNNNVTLEIMSEKGVTVSRSFYSEDGLKIVNHDLFDVPQDMQGNGMSKDFLKAMYLRYKRAGIDRIDMISNKDIGGYAWARYGFTYKDGQEWLKQMLRTQGDGLVDGVDEAIKIVENWYEHNSAFDPFPMNLLTGYKWSKELLLGSYWEAELHLDDVIQMDVFERYLGIK